MRLDCCSYIVYILYRNLLVILIFTMHMCDPNSGGGGLCCNL